jgi:hypothetical protein
MAKSIWLMLLAALVLVSPSWAATRDGERPDKEMLRMIDFLREMEMIKQMEMMEDMQNFESPEDRLPEAPAQKSAPTTKKEASK